MYRDLDIRLTPEQATLRQTAHGFAAEVLRPAAAHLDRLADPNAVTARGSLFWRALKQAYRLGFHRTLIPAEHGGLGLDGLAQHLVFEELGWGSADLALTIGMAALPFIAVAATGDPDLTGEFVRPFVEDTEARVIGCWALTEPDHGSDMLMVGTPRFHDPRVSGEVIARRQGESYVLNGRKSAFVSNATIATHALTFVTLDPARGMAGGGLAIVPLGVHGVTRGKPLDKMGQRALDQAELAFEDVRIAERYMFSGRSLCEFAVGRTLVLVHGIVGAVFTGVARAAYEAALAYSAERMQGGKPLCEHQLVQKRLFEMFSRVEACRALSRAAMGYNHETLPPAAEYAIASKVFCTEGALAVADSALQLFGGAGLTHQYAVEKLFRDARASIVQHGSNDVLALAAARRLVDAAADPRQRVRGAA